jgi:hypothetical protein
MPADPAARADFFEEIGAEFSKTPRTWRETAVLTVNPGAVPC